ncbi:MAG: hypothetical protein L3J23_03650 [Flavobacteriaceae bacterium]|nr:hypothetical protein [Flavobacteriaceae bacterium]
MNFITKKFFFGIIFISQLTFSQEFTTLETKEEKAKKEEVKYLKFQTHFFEALHQKSREDYTKAIEFLDNCKTIYPNDVALNFEYTKNYLKLKDYDNAIFFAEKALEKKPNNVFILEHLKETYRLQRDYKNAIIIQKKIIVLRPSKENDLIYLYITNKQRAKAKITYLKLERFGLLDLRKNYFKRILFSEKKKKEKIIKDEVEIKDKSYKSFIILLKKEQPLDKLVKNSKEALSLFPAQPKLYLINSTAQNQLKKYKKALENLEVGLDFIIDDDDMLVNFYNQMQIAYLGLGQQNNATKYLNKALSLRKLNK